MQEDIFPNHWKDVFILKNHKTAPIFLPTMNILLIEDNPLLVIGMTSILTKEIPNARISQIDTIKESSSILQENECQLLILDINVADGKNLDAFATIRNWYPKMHVLVYLADEYIYLAPFSKAGANGFISIRSTANEIREAVASRSSGNRFISHDVQAYIIQQLAKQSVLVPLSARERQVARMLSEDKSYDEIALTLGVERKNVPGYKSRVFQKLGVSSILELSKIVRSEG